MYKFFKLKTFFIFFYRAYKNFSIQYSINIVQIFSLQFNYTIQHKNIITIIYNDQKQYIIINIIFHI